MLMLTLITKATQKSKLTFITKTIPVGQLRTSTDLLQIKAFMHSSLQGVQSTCALTDLH